MNDNAETGELTITLPGDEQILISRELDAPANLAYRAWTTPELVKRWWAGRRGTVIVADIDLRVGGAWRYVLKTNDGTEVGFHGEYRHIVANERLVHTEFYEMAGAEESPENTTLTTVTFTETAGRTRVDLLVDCPSTQLRDVILNSGMEIGVKEQFEVLDEITASLR